VLPRVVPNDANEELLLKFSIDNAQMTKHKIFQEAAGFDILRPGQALASVKSPDECHLWAMYIGQETVPELDVELAQGFRMVEQLNGKLLWPILYVK